MRTIAILAAYNEERFIAGCIEHYARQGVEVYLIDHGSTDQTVTIAERYWDKGLIGLEHFPRNEFHEWKLILERKEELATTLKADWFMHADPDEVRLAPQAGWTLAEAFEYVEQQGYNAVNFMEFTFIPVQEAPDHNHPDFQKTMRWYYPFLPLFPHGLKAWKRQPQRAELAWSAGHRIRFPDLRMYPESFPMRHYQFLSMAHAVTKYAPRKYPSAALEAGWHGWRANVQPDWLFPLPPKADLLEYRTDQELDASNPRQSHYLADILEGQPNHPAAPTVSTSPSTSHIRPKTQAPQIVCVLGMHRSGTSLTARLINLLGVDWGPAEELMEPGETKAAGFWEHTEITQLNDQLLARLGGSWHQPPQFSPGWQDDSGLADLKGHAQSVLKRFEGLELWGWKDPRTCLTLPFWQALITQPVAYVICLRNPVDIAASLEQRDGFTFEKSVHLWVTYTQLALASTANQPRHFVFYDDFFSDEQTTLRALARFLGKAYPVEQAPIRQSIQRFINSELRHHQTTVPATIAASRLSYPVKALYTALHFALSRPDRNPDETQQAMTLLAQQLADFQNDFDNLQSRADHWKKRALEREAHLDLIYHSTSWRLTYPLRWVGDTLRGRNTNWLAKILKRIFGT